MAEEASDTVIWMRPERAATGRPAGHTRDEITAAAIRIADREGLDAVSMRRVAADLGTGAASLYRYVSNRDDLLDLMIDATAAEYVLAPPSGDWLDSLLSVGGQARGIMRRHRWLPPLLISRSVLGPNGLVLLEHVLDVLAGHPASTAAKLEAFGTLNAVTALFVHNEQTGSSERQQRNAAYLRYALAAGDHPRLAALLAPQAATPPGEAPDPESRFRDILARILTGLLALLPAVEPHRVITLLGLQHGIRARARARPGDRGHRQSGAYPGQPRLDRRASGAPHRRGRPRCPGAVAPPGRRKPDRRGGGP